MLTKDFHEALKLLAKHGRGVVVTKAGVSIRGSLCDAQSSDNDPEGIGYFTIRPDDGELLVDVYANDFKGLREAG